MKRIIVIGGGASGIVAAIRAKNNDNEVIVLANAVKSYLLRVMVDVIIIMMIKI